MPPRWARPQGGAREDLYAPTITDTVISNAFDPEELQAESVPPQQQQSSAKSNRRLRFSYFSDLRRSRQQQQQQQQNEPTNGMTLAQQALAAAIDVNDDTVRAIAHMEHVLNETEMIGIETADEVGRSREGLQVIDQALEGIEPMSKRAQKDVVVFFRRMMRDKCFVCIVTLVLCIVVGIIVVSQVRKDESPANIFAPLSNFSWNGGRV